uniref:Truncated MgrB n=1 Tax=Klebsiella pneumoniae TaxID=573 RepID=A0A097F1N3_KLEPN|nr:truncated MgrB [Klebsiella pneumoniae]
MKKLRWVLLIVIIAGCLLRGLRCLT